MQLIIHQHVGPIIFFLLQVDNFTLFNLNAIHSFYPAKRIQ